MVAEKLNWFRKAIAGLGKRLFFRSTNKVSLLSVNGMLRSVIRTYAELNDNNYEKGLKKFYEQIQEESKNLISEMIAKPLLLGASMESILSKDVEDLPFLASIVFWALMGKDSKKIFEEAEFVKLADGSYKLIIKQNMCIICAQEYELKAQDFGSESFGDIFALLFSGVIQAFTDYVGNEYTITAEESKCFMRGDPHGEITIILSPRK
ncbi:MAG: hypothetical protein ACTSRG_14920 [Candidatus Helarchaeota archaeon]